MNLDAEKYMKLALEEAQLAYSQGEVPIGAILVDRRTGQVISAEHNQKERNQIATDHAEILAIQSANKKLGTWRLEDTAMFVTVEPCLMCAGAIIQSRIPELYYGAADMKFGAVESLYQTLTDPRSNHRVDTHLGIMAEESRQLMQNFFLKIRKG
jgi:tRNA(adenine34) deaminase